MSRIFRSRVWDSGVVVSGGKTGPGGTFECSMLMCVAKVEDRARDLELIHPSLHGLSGCLAGGLKGDLACILCETTPAFG